MFWWRLGSLQLGAETRHRRTSSTRSVLGCRRASAQPSPAHDAAFGSTRGGERTVAHICICALSVYHIYICIQCVYVCNGMQCNTMNAMRWNGTERNVTLMEWNVMYVVVCMSVYEYVHTNISQDLYPGLVRAIKTS